LSEPWAGVRVVLIGDKGHASLQYIPRIDPTATVVFPPLRFDSGNVDEVLLLAPHLGALSLQSSPSLFVCQESSSYEA
jgi:hypothetical protein